MPLFTDQTGRSVQMPHHPQRIVSLVPSQTELLYYLGLDAAVAGITKFCVHPAQWHASKTRIGGTKDINIPLIRSLQPELIIAGKEENVLEQVAHLWDEFPTWISDVGDMQAAQEMITAVGAMTSKPKEALHLAQEIRGAFKQVPAPAIKAAYLIWRKPYMTVGGDTYINDMMQRAGFKNVFNQRLRYPEVSISDIRASGCKVVLLSSEPYPFKEKHRAELETALPGITAMLVDGEMFSWYGSRMLLAPDYFKCLYHAAATECGMLKKEETSAG